MLYLSHFLCCLSLKTGCIIIVILDILVSLACIPIFICVHIEPDYCFYFAVAIVAVHLVSRIFLLGGTFSDYCILLLISMVFSIAVIIMGIAFVATGLAVSAFNWSYIGILLYILLEMYFFCVIISFWDQCVDE